jgi:predicted small secreted protein
MKRLISAFAVLSLVLTGCGSSVCEDFKGVSEDLTEKSKPCSDGTTGTDEPFDVQQCEADFVKCTDDDKKALEEYIDCLGDVDTCVKGQEDIFGGAVLACAFAAAGKLSDACTSTVSQGIQRTAAGYSVAR